MRWDYPPLDINPVFSGLRDIIIIIIIIIITIELTHSKTVLENTVEIESQPVAFDFKNLFQYSSNSLDYDTSIYARIGRYNVTFNTTTNC